MNKTAILDFEDLDDRQPTHAAVELMSIMARAAGHRQLSDFELSGLTTVKRDTANFTGVAYGGVGGTV